MQQIGTLTTDIWRTNVAQYKVWFSNCVGADQGPDILIWYGIFTVCTQKDRNMHTRSFCLLYKASCTRLVSTPTTCIYGSINVLTCNHFTHVATYSTCTTKSSHVPSSLWYLNQIMGTSRTIHDRSIYLPLSRSLQYTLQVIIQWKDL